MLPPAFRKVFAEYGDDKVLCLAKHERWPCLRGFSLSLTHSIEEQLDREEAYADKRQQDFDRELRGSQLLTFSEVPFDSSGRFVLPDHLSGMGGIGDAIYFQGGTPFMTLWDPQKLYAMGPEWENAQAICRTLAADALSKGKRK